MGRKKEIKTNSAVSITYSMYDFLAAVKRQRLLWERNHPHYHLRARRQQTWRYVARQLYNNFDQLSDVEQYNIGRTLQKRWKNARDSFFKAHRAKMGGDQLCSYIYEEEMSFLLNTENNDITIPESDMDDQAKEVTDERNDTRTPKSQEVEPKAQRASKRQKQSLASEVGATIKVEETNNGRSPKKIRKTKLSQSREDLRVLEELSGPSDDLTPTTSSIVEEAGRTDEHRLVDKTLTPKKSAQLAVDQSSELQMIGDGKGEIDADQAFFDSIKPAMRDLSIDRKLDLQIDILKLLRNYRSK